MKEANARTKPINEPNTPAAVYVIFVEHIQRKSKTRFEHAQFIGADFTGQNLNAHTTLPMRIVWHRNPVYGHMFPTHIRISHTL